MTWTFGARIVVEGAVLAAGVLSAYVWASGPRANTMAFVALVLIHPFQAMNCRSDRVGWWRLPSNSLIWASLVTLVLAQWCATSWPPLARLLGTSPLSGADWAVVAVAVGWPVLVLEVAKSLRARRST